jgi:chorismate mutase
LRARGASTGTELEILAMTAPTAASSAEQTAPEIGDLRTRIDEVDAELIRLWQERAELSRQIGVARMAAGGTRLVLAREQQIIDKFRDALGADGAQLAMLVLRAGRGSL